MTKIGTTYWVDFENEKNIPNIGDKIYLNNLDTPTEKCEVIGRIGSDIHFKVIGVVGFEGEQ